jgi:trans-2,3-dihydro-3-hydroxyanthranilate isomerase
MPRYRFLTCDVFTEARFGGNQLAVLPDARGLTTAQMQQITREFNFAESTFVLPSERHTRQVRIFTPASEMPFAGHPNVGTAFVLASIGELGPLGPETTIVFDEIAGPVPIRITSADSRVWCELTAPQALTLGAACSAEAVARAVSLDPTDIVTTTHPPQAASVGAQFLCAELRSVDALARSRPNLDGIAALAGLGVPEFVHLYVRSNDDYDLRARMYAPSAGILEDPATGSANVALAAMLAQLDPRRDAEFAWRIGQGIEMGRPSVLEARAVKEAGVVTRAFIGGSCVMMMEGTIDVG